MADSSASDSDHDEVETPAHVRPKGTSASNGGDKSLKSEKESKITTTVLYPQPWPHSFLSLTNTRRDIKYDDLTLEEFVAGYGQIRQSPDLTEMERSARLKHLVSLMYFAQQYEWQAVLSFHGAVLLAIERRLLKWGDSLFLLETRAVLSTGIPRRPNHVPVEDLPRPPPQSCIVEISNGNSVLLIKHIMATFAARESGCGIFAPTAGCNQENKSTIALALPNVPLPLQLRRQKTIYLEHLRPPC